MLISQNTKAQPNHNSAPFGTLFLFDLAQNYITLFDKSHQIYRVYKKIKNMLIKQVRLTEIMTLHKISELIRVFAKQGFMLEQSSHQLMMIARNGNLFAAYDAVGNVVASAGITFQYEHSFEFGAWCVVPELQRTHIGTSILKHVLIHHHHHNYHRPIFAVANINSAPIFEKLGAPEMAESDMEPEVFVPCATCNCDKSTLGAKKCVDRFFNLGPIAQRFIREGR